MEDDLINKNKLDDELLKLKVQNNNQIIETQELKLKESQ